MRSTAEWHGKCSASRAGLVWQTTAAGVPQGEGTMHPLPTIPHPRRGAAGRIIVHMSGEPHAIRTVGIWPIADVLGLDDHLDALRCDGTIPPDASGEPDADVLADLLDSQFITPPRPGRRQRLVSSRAVFFHAAE